MIVSLTVSLMALLLHRNQLRGRPLVTGPAVPSEFLVEVGQLLVKLAPCLCELVEACPTLGVSGAVTRCHLLVGGAARVRCHADEALARGFTRVCRRCPLGCHGARGDVGRS
jgi:hypothetical protein